MHLATRNRQIWAIAFLLVCAFALPAQPADNPPLVFLHYWTGGLSGGIHEMGQAFNRTGPEYPVETKGFDHEAFKVSISPMLAGGSPPDMFSYWAGAKVQALVKENYLAPIDTVWSEAKLDRVFPKSVAKACTYFGHKYALPLTQHYVGLFYNKKIFARHNITPPENWEQFIAACDKLKGAGIIPIAMGSRERWPAQFWFDYLLLRTAGPEYRQRLMNGLASYTDPEVKQVFKVWKSLLQAAHFNPSPNLLNWTDAAKLVHSGEAAMTLMGTWTIGLFDGQLGWKQGEDYDFFPFPAMNSDIPMTALGPIDVIVVPRQGRPTQVNAVLSYFSKPGPQMEMSKGSGALSPSRSIPSSFYTELQQRIATHVRKTPYWAFNYDLATPPRMAEHGLNTFKNFIYAPDSYNQILIDLARKADAFFAHPQ